MLPMKALRLELGEALAADADILAPAADANKVALIIAEFTPNENMVIGDLTLATFTGSTPLLAGVGTQQVGIDPATQQQRITIKEPAGGWRWECTAAPTPAQVIFGYALTNNAADELYGVALLDEPLTISEVGDEVNLDKICLTFVTQPMS